jgi:hypothetical protein
MEVISIICHDIAAMLFINAEGGLCKPNSANAQPLQVPGEPPLILIPPKPMELFHTEYLDWGQYSKGIVDIAGHWAEYRLFGGVVLFDRGESGTEVYISSLLYQIDCLAASSAMMFSSILLGFAGYTSFQRHRSSNLPTLYYQIGYSSMRSLMGYVFVLKSMHAASTLTTQCLFIYTATNTNEKSRQLDQFAVWFAMMISLN